MTAPTEISGVSETLLWPLYNRAAEARRSDAILQDPHALRILEQIDYPFRDHFGAPDEYHVLRALRFDEQVRDYLRVYPEALVIGLGDGLETQFWRADNGRATWLSVDLPPVIEMRRRFMPDADRRRNLACSALSPEWREGIDASRGVFITAQGLLMYFTPDEVRQLIAECATLFPNGRMMFDVIPRWYSQNTMRGYDMTKAYRTPPMPFGMDAHEISSIRGYHPNIMDVRNIDPGRGRSFHFRYKMPVLKRIPILGRRRSSFVLVNFGAGTAAR